MNDRIRTNLKKAMSEKDITQTDIAQRLGIKQPNISRYLRGVSGEVPENWQVMLEMTDLELTAINPKLLGFIEQLTASHGEEWLLDRLEVLAALEEAENQP